MMRFLRSYRSALQVLGYSVLAGVIAGVGYAVPHVWVLAVIGIAVFFFLVFQRSRGRSLVYLQGVAFSAVYFGVVLVWFFDALPLTWLGIESNFFGMVAVLSGYLVVVGMFSLWTGGVVALLHMAYRNGRWWLLLVPVFWVLGEYVRTWLFSFLTYGSGAELAPHFTAGHVGYALASQGILLQVARFGGVYLLSAVVIMLALVLWMLWTARRTALHDLRYGIVATLVFALVVSAGITPTIFVGEKMRQMEVALVHTDLTPRVTYSDAEEYGYLLTHLALLTNTYAQEHAPEVIVFPADAHFLARINRYRSIPDIRALMPNETQLVIDAARTRTLSGVAHARILYYLPHTGSIVTSEKSFLIPYGEYTPVLTRGMFAVFGLEDIRRYLVEARRYRAGEGPTVVRMEKGIVGVLFLSEVFSPSLHRAVVRAGAEYFVSVASPSWLNHSVYLHDQIIAMAKVHAVTHDRYYVQAGNRTPSFVISNSGALIAESDFAENSVLYSTVWY